MLRDYYGNTILDFSYDANGQPYSMHYNSTPYFYILNLQGDVIRMVDGNGNTVASYEYDPYGRVISATGSMADINPLRYRGYYYDQETQLYHLWSRYYDPQTGRFINADSYASTGAGIVGNNMFAYCLNNPILYKDSLGDSATIAVAIGVSALKSLLFSVVVIVVLVDAIQHFVENQDSISTNASSFTEVRPDWLDVQTQSIEEKLTKSLERARQPQSQKTHIHHIVAQNDKRASLAQLILSLVNIDINNVINLVLVKETVHHRLHTNVYFNTVNYMMYDAYASAGTDKGQQLENVTNALLFLQAYIASLNALSP